MPVQPLVLKQRKQAEALRARGTRNRLRALVHLYALRATVDLASSWKSGYGASFAFSRRPVSRASRPFIGPILKGSKGSNLRVHGTVRERQQFARSCR